MFFVAYVIVALACASITIKTLVGYSTVSRVNKITISLLILVSWLSPLIFGWLKHLPLMNSKLYSVLSFVGYAAFGFFFLVFILLLMRDVVWYAIYGIAKSMGFDSWSLNPKNISVLSFANRIVLLMALFLTGCALHEGTKFPEFNEIDITHKDLRNNYRVIQLSDLHIDRSTPVSKIYKLVETTNNLGADAIFLTGDIIDDDLGSISEQLEALKHLQAPLGVYVSIGNHELYNGLNTWLYKYEQMGFKVLLNKGVRLADDLFVGGVPDAFTANSNPQLNVNFMKTLDGSERDQYRILLSHNPELVNSISAFNFQLMLSGHTHGGQIFPFHIFVKKANEYLSGDYMVNGIHLHVSNGVGTWGPTMRLFAPSEITIINLLKKTN